MGGKRIVNATCCCRTPCPNGCYLCQQDPPPAYIDLTISGVTDDGCDCSTLNATHRLTCTTTCRWSKMHYIGCPGNPTYNYPLDLRLTYFSSAWWNYEQYHVYWSFHDWQFWADLGSFPPTFDGAGNPIWPDHMIDCCASVGLTLNDIFGPVIDECDWTNATISASPVC